MKIILSEKQIKSTLPLFEYYQQAVKKYSNKITEDDFIELKRIMGDSPYFRVGADLFFHFKKFNDNQDSNLLLVKRLFDNLQKYDKKIFPLKYEITDYNNETNVHGQHVMDLYSKLENRQRLVNEFKKLPSIGQRNLGYLKKIVIDDEYRPNTYIDRLRVLNRLIETLPDNERGQMALNKIFNNKNDLDKSLATAEQFAMGFNENEDISKDELIEKLSNFDVEIVQNSENILVFRVDDHNTFIHLTCNSMWCFSRPGSEGYWNEYAE